MAAKRFWNPLYIGIITYFCLVLPGVILFAINFEKLGKPRFKLPMIILGCIGFFALLLGWLYLPKEWDTELAIVHMGSSIGIAAWQYSSYRKALDEDENAKVESLFKPALLSILFLIVLFLLITCRV
jgi:peptidoglycan/LPS O-acetylase OafA/YrhL